ncbi:hypothetical protein [Actinomadura miaoliensis]|uniref:Lipoprotein n=1 Tax=Actinomadura miaoliensis TaxID=430685 RepID=A0ABP7WXT6_9ACTN
MPKWSAAVQVIMLATVLAACGSDMDTAMAAAESERVMNRTVQALHPDYRALPKGPQPDVREVESCRNLLTGDQGKVRVGRNYAVSGLSEQRVNEVARRVEKFWDEEIGAHSEESKGFDKNEPWVTMRYKDFTLTVRVTLYKPRDLRISVESDCIQPNGDT